MKHYGSRIVVTDKRADEGSFESAIRYIDGARGCEDADASGPDEDINDRHYND